MGFLTGKTAIITGAGFAALSDGRCGSIGYGIATAYAKEGAITQIGQAASITNEAETITPDNTASITPLNPIIPPRAPNTKAGSIPCAAA